MMRLPNFIGIGAQKAGTTWLHTMLCGHPGIWLPPVKEIEYLAWPDDAAARRQKHQALVAPLASRLARAKLSPKEKAWFDHLLKADSLDDDWYLQLFAGQSENVIVGEICPEYAPMSAAQIRRAHDLAPAAKVIVLLRHPVERAWATALAYCKYLRVDPRDAITSGDYRKLITHDSAVQRGLYAQWLERWEGQFGVEKVFVGFFEDLAARPLDLLERLCAFLDVPFSPDLFPQAGDRFNVSPQIPMPSDVPVLIAQLYLKDLERLATRFRTPADGSVHAWLAGLQAARAAAQ